MDTTLHDWMCLPSRSETTHTLKKGRISSFFTFLGEGVIQCVCFGDIWVNHIHNRVCSRGGGRLGGGGAHIHAVVLSLLEGQD